MVPAKPKSVVLVESIVKALKAISSQRDSTEWFSMPRAITAGVVIAPDSFALPRPSLFITIDLGRDVPSGATRHEQPFTLTIIALIDAKDAGVGALYIDADVRHAIAIDEQLSSSIYGMIELESAGFDYEASAAYSCGVYRMVYSAKYVWDHDAS